jgi:hypothetical protein
MRLAAIATDDQESRTELDSHADTCVVGANDLLTHDYEVPMKVTGYDKSAGHKVYKTVSAAVAYDDPITGTTIILHAHQAILIPQISHNLLCPMQLRINDVEVNDVPKFLVRHPTDRTHSIVIATDDNNDLIIPLALAGVTSYFPTRKPTRDEYARAIADGRYYNLTAANPPWDPSSTSFQDQEEERTDHRGLLRDARFARSFESAKRKRKSSPMRQAHNFHPVASTPTSLKPFEGGQNDEGLGIPDGWTINAVQTQKTPKMDASTLARRWGIGLEAATRTLKKTTQRGIRTTLDPTLDRQFRTNDRQLRYRRLPTTLFADTLLASKPSRRKNTCAEVFVHRNGWKRAYPMKTKSQAHEALSLLFAREGVPAKLIVDGSKEQTLGKFRQKAREADCYIHTTEPYTPHSNAAEGGIRELKKGVGRKMVRSKSPRTLWDDCLELEAYIQSYTWSSIYELDDEVPETMIMGDTAEISQYCQHGWYEWIKFRDTAQHFPEPKMTLGRYLGPKIDVGPAMTAKILKANGQVVHRSTYRALNESEWASEAERLERNAFDVTVEIKLGPSMKPDDLPVDGTETPMYERYEDDDGERHRHADDEEAFTPEEADNFVNAEVALMHHGKRTTGKVRNRKRQADGSLVGLANHNPILDTRTYDVQFPDGEVAEYAANIIAENVWAQCDPDGRQRVLMEAIIDHKMDGHALKPADSFVTLRGKQHRKRTTQGWLLCIEWKDRSTSWERLADVKESYPIEAAEYAVTQGIDHDPAFVWWAAQTLKRRNRIIATLKNRRYHKRTHQYGFEIPRNVLDAQRIDGENGNTLWMDSIRKEMQDVAVAFDILDDDAPDPVGHQKIRCHLIYSIKMEDFRRKSRYVAGGHETKPPATLTYASVVSRETVRIALTLAALNDLEVKASDIQNAYLTAPNAEKIYTVLGPEHGINANKRAIVTRALYGLKSAGASFRHHLADCMRSLGYKPCLADPDLWYKPEVRPSDDHHYYAYILLYVDDCLAMHHDAEGELHRLDKYFKMKKDSIGDPAFYLGAKLRPTALPNGVTAWGMSSSKYVQEAVRNIDEYLRSNNDGMTLAKRAPTPFPSGYAPEIDDSQELNPENVSHFQSHIGILRWIVELGRIDIITEVSQLSSYLALPRDGHLEAVYHIYAYLKHKHNARLVLDPTYPTIDQSVFKKCDWKEFYGDAIEPIPPNAPPARGKMVDLRLFVDSSHADDKRIRRSRTGYFIFLNMAPVAWLSKKQPTVETSVFGAEFVAMKNGMEAVRGLRYKLRMMGVELSGPTYIYGDNMSVIHNTQRPESTLKKKSNSICYHAIRESVAMGESLTGHVSTHHNPADIATKIVPGGRKRDYLISLILHDIADEHPD